VLSFSDQLSGFGRLLDAVLYLRQNVAQTRIQLELLSVSFKFDCGGFFIDFSALLQLPAFFLQLGREITLEE